MTATYVTTKEQAVMKTLVSIGKTRSRDTKGSGLSAYSAGTTKTRITTLRAPTNRSTL